MPVTAYWTPYAPSEKSPGGMFCLTGGIDFAQHVSREDEGLSQSPCRDGRALVWKMIAQELALFR
jgi:hypothetical protein